MTEKFIINFLERGAGMLVNEGIDRLPGPVIFFEKGRTRLGTDSPFALIEEGGPFFPPKPKRCVRADIPADRIRKTGVLEMIDDLAPVLIPQIERIFKGP